MLAILISGWLGVLGGVVEGRDRDEQSERCSKGPTSAHGRHADDDSNGAGCRRKKKQKYSQKGASHTFPLVLPSLSLQPEKTYTYEVAALRWANLFCRSFAPVTLFWLSNAAQAPSVKASQPMNALRRGQIICRADRRWCQAAKVTWGMDR